MSRAYSDIAFTPSVRAMQTRMGSRENYAALDNAPDRRDRLGANEAAFIEGRDGFYQATVSETGWPYVQFRGGPAGFLKVLDERTIGYADFRGNVQYISVGNLLTDDRVAIILMDYANQRRLKLLGHARLVQAQDDPGLIAQLQMPDYRAQIERAVVITIEGYDWNCPQHITPRFTEEEIALATAPLRQQVQRLLQDLAQSKSSAVGARPAIASLGHGPLTLTIAGIRQLTPRVRAYELRAPDGADLPAIGAGAHIDVPVRLADSIEATRRYSISSNPGRRDAYEIAVLREEAGSGGSRAVHEDFQLGIALHCGLPGNDFPLHEDGRPAVLVAGGIGITPIKSMALALATAGRRFQLHYAGRSAREMAYRDRLQREFGPALTTYFGDAGERMNVEAVIEASPPDAVFYVCGPERLIHAVRAAAQSKGIDAERVRFERFLAAPLTADEQPVQVSLRRSGKTLAVPATQSILDAVQAAGIDAPAACRTGTCGTCAVKVLAGEPDHRDSVLSQAERERAGLMCICVSRAKTPDLTLDL